MERGLLLCTQAERIRSKIDLLSALICPKDRMTVFANADLLEVFGILQVCKNLSTCNHGPKIDNPGVLVVPLHLEHTGEDRLRGDDSGNLGHAQRPILMTMRP